VSENAFQDAPVLASRVRSAVIWRSGSQIAAQSLMWAATIMVVRLLNPEDYGLFAMSQVVLVALNFLNAQSFASSLIQEQDVTEHRIAQVFGILILFNVTLAAVQFLSAPAIAAYYHQPIIESMLRVQTLIYCITPFISLPIVLLARRLDFKNQAKADLVAALSGATTALSGAYFGLGVWTLVIAPIVMSTVRAIGLNIATRSLPLPSFNFKGAGSILSFGSALVLCQFFWVLQSQSDVAIAGRLVNPHHLGLYSEALFLTLILSAKFIPPLNEVAFPAYTQLAKAGGDVGKAFVTAARLVMFLALPAYLGMSAAAGPLVDTLFGAKWHAMIPLVAGLPLAMPFFALQIICSPTTNALGKPGIYVRTSIAGATILPCAFLIGSRWGIIGLMHAWQIATPIFLIVTLALTLPVIGVSWRRLLWALMPSIASATAMAAIVRYVATQITQLAPVAQLGILVSLGAALYVGLLWTLSRQTLEDLYRLVVKRDTSVVAGVVA
jgi:O-antigen/teichoic acid export membrane protein